MKSRFQERYTSKLIEGKESGYGEARLRPSRKESSKRRRRSKKTIQSQQRANERRSCHTCYLEALENFGNHDYFLSITFKPTLADAERIELLKKVIRFLQRRGKKNGDKLKYIYNWGRGELCNQLHSHMLLNRVVSFDDIVACCKHYKDIHIDVEYIGSGFKQSEEENIRYIIYYIFYKHWDSLKDDDKKLIGKRYYGSRSLNKFYVTEIDDDDIDRDITDSPSKLMAAIANAADFDSIDKIVRRVFKGYRLEGFYYDGGKSPIYTDFYGQSFARLKLVKIGSKLDSRYVYDNGFKVDRYTGEVVEK